MSNPVIRLQGPLDATAVASIRRRLAHIPSTASTVVLDCAGVTAVDPVGAASLWRACADALAQGRRVLLVDLPARFAWRLRRHPLLAHACREDALFTDPFATAAPSER